MAHTTLVCIVKEIQDISSVYKCNSNHTDMRFEIGLFIFLSRILSIFS